MQDFRTNFQRLSKALPIMVLMALMNTIVCSAVALVVMIELQFAYPNSRWPLGIGILVALIVWVWIAYNHKLRIYIEKQGSN